MKNSIVIAVILSIIVGAGAFFAGMKYQQGKQPSFARQGGQGRTNAGQSQGNRTAFRPISGEIINADEKSVTVKLQDGSSKIVLLTEKTALNKAAEASKTDLKVGEKVAVFGQENSDGSVTAQNIQLNPTQGRLNNQ